MGHIQTFDLNNLMYDYDLKTYIETGTGEGTCLRHALEFPFQKIYSIEYDKSLFDLCSSQFKDPRVTLINELSSTALNGILPLIEKETNVLFFLDAHFPEADFGVGNDRYEQSIKKYGKDALPLQEELELIRLYHYRYDVIIIDDLRIYETFEDSSWPERPKNLINSIDPSLALFQNSHRIERIYKQQGYIILYPNL